MTRSDRRIPAAPSHLGREAKALWRSVLADFDLESHHLALLQAACEALGRTTEAREAIARDGAYVVGRFGPKAHPALATERDSRMAMTRILRELGLDLEAPATSRPPTRWRPS
jgi:P27 family predicted phage terminase small subunit